MRYPLEPALKPHYFFPPGVQIRKPYTTTTGAAVRSELGAAVPGLTSLCSRTPGEEGRAFLGNRARGEIRTHLPAHVWRARLLHPDSFHPIHLWDAASPLQRQEEPSAALFWRMADADRLGEQTELQEQAAGPGTGLCQRPESCCSLRIPRGASVGQQTGPASAHGIAHGWPHALTAPCGSGTCPWFRQPPLPLTDTAKAQKADSQVGRNLQEQELMLGLVSQEPKGGNNTQQQGMGKNGFCQANLIYF